MGRFIEVQIRVAVAVEFASRVTPVARTSGRLTASSVGSKRTGFQENSSSDEIEDRQNANSARYGVLSMEYKRRNRRHQHETWRRFCLTESLRVQVNVEN